MMILRELRCRRWEEAFGWDKIDCIIELHEMMAPLGLCLQTVPA